MVLLAGKVMATVSCNGLCVIQPHSERPKYQWRILCQLERQLQKAIKSKRPGKWMKGVLFQQDNAPAHKSVVAMTAVRVCGFELVNHPPHYPDLATSDYFLFLNMIKHLAGEKYGVDDEVISAVEDFYKH